MVGISILQINNGLNVKSVITKMSLVQEKNSKNVMYKRKYLWSISHRYVPKDR